jgi:hypothetical protein
MAETLEQIYCMFPNTALLLMDGWAELGTGITVVEDQGTPTDGETHAAEMVADKVTVNFLRSRSLTDDSSNRVKFITQIKFAQRDTYLNENPRHHFLRVFDNAGATEIGTVYYEGVGVNDNKIGIQDKDGVRTDLATGPFFADRWYEFQLVMQHANSVNATLWIDDTAVGSAISKNFHSTAGDLEFKVQGQIKNAGGPGGSTWCSFAAYAIDANIAPKTAAFAKFMFRPFAYFDANPVCDRLGVAGGPALTAGTADAFYDNDAATRAGYRAPGGFQPIGGAWACDRNIDVSGAASRFASGTVPRGMLVGAKHDHAVKGASASDPHILYGKANAGVDTFTLSEFDALPLGPNIYSSKFVLPSDGSFPGINDFVMLGLLHKGLSVTTFFIEEILAGYIVEHPRPPLVQVRMFGDALGLGDAVGAA